MSAVILLWPILAPSAAKAAAEKRRRREPNLFELIDAMGQDGTNQDPDSGRRRQVRAQCCEADPDAVDNRQQGLSGAAADGLGRAGVLPRGSTSRRRDRASDRRLRCAQRGGGASGDPICEPLSIAGTRRSLRNGICLAEGIAPWASAFAQECGRSRGYPSRPGDRQNGAAAMATASRGSSCSVAGRAVKLPQTPTSTS